MKFEIYILTVSLVTEFLKRTIKKHNFRTGKMNHLFLYFQTSNPYIMACLTGSNFSHSLLTKRLSSALSLKSHSFSEEVMIRVLLYNLINYL